MTTDVKKIGELLKKKREEMHFSLKEVESSTSIRTSYLEAIEKGISDKFLSNVYMHGFIRHYASFLGINMQSLAQEYPEIFAPSKLKHEFLYGIGTLEVRGSVGGGVKWFSNFIWAGGAVIGLTIIWQFAKWLGWL
ncbi:MAG: helix-turn-helix domain-containing protein [Simkaniaceae bacterium]|nr:helix-turn-helix domain-containing protein [Simkaniaceae bacterium]MCF7852738.1 helix-turn-helix domain-containing protein [Simkaniaceae bacterium]